MFRPSLSDDSPRIGIAFLEVALCVSRAAARRRAGASPDRATSGAFEVEGPLADQQIKQK